MRAELTGIAVVKSADLSLPTDLPDELTRDYMTGTGVVPVLKEGDLQIGLVDPLDRRLLDSIRFLLGVDAPEAAMSSRDLHRLFEAADKAGMQSAEEARAEAAHDPSPVEDGATVRLVEDILAHAVADRA